MVDAKTSRRTPARTHASATPAVPSTLTWRNPASSSRAWGRLAARCITTSAPAHAGSTLSGSRMLPVTCSMPGPNGRRSRTRGRAPSSFRRATTARPTTPEPPVTSITGPSPTRYPSLSGRAHDNAYPELLLQVDAGVVLEVATALHVQHPQRLGAERERAPVPRAPVQHEHVEGAQDEG